VKHHEGLDRSGLVPLVDGLCEEIAPAVFTASRRRSRLCEEGDDVKTNPAERVAS